jgi:hypothetical protein
MRDFCRVVVSALLLGLAAAASLPSLAGFRHVALDLPGPPACVIPTDLDRDGRTDLVVVIAYTEWGSTGYDRVEGAVQVSQVVPTLFERRDLLFYRNAADGSLVAGARPLALEKSVIAIAAGPAGHPLLALTDDGVEDVVLDSDPDGPVLRFRLLFDETPIAAGAGAFLPELRWVRDADGDGDPDVVVPTPRGIRIHLTDGTGFAAPPLSEVTLPGMNRQSGSTALQQVPVPRFEDVDGNGIPDLVVQTGGAIRPAIWVMRGKGGARFENPVRLSTGCLGLGEKPELASDLSAKQRRKAERKRAEREGESGTSWSRARQLAHFGDLDGDGRAEVVTRASVDTQHGEMREVNEPRFRYRFYRLRPDLSPETKPYQELEVTGHVLEGNFWEETSGLFRDLDGDRRAEMVTVTLDLSMFKMLGALASKKISISTKFGVWTAGTGATYRRVDDLGLEEKLKVDLSRLSLSRLAQFAGDFDADGRVDYLHVGPGKMVSIHLGRPGCRWPVKPDEQLELEDEPENLLLLRISDLDGDGRSDLRLTRTSAASEEPVSSRVRLDLYLSGGSR